MPTILSPDEEIRLRAHYKVDDEASIRNSIIVLLMLDLGLRCSEVSSLCITDIHWNNGIIHLGRTKNQHNRELPMSRESVRGVIRRAFKKENIQGWWKGTHALRRTAASKIYNRGNSLKLTADVLGHESLDSTKQYVRVDFQQLREAASPWPGGSSDDR